MEESRHHFGVMFQAARIRKRLTMGQAAQELGVSVVEISGIESGRQPPPADTRISAWAELADLQVEQLITAAQHDREHVDFDARVLRDRKLFWTCDDLFPGFKHYATGAVRPERCPAQDEAGSRCRFNVGHLDQAQLEHEWE